MEDEITEDLVLKASWVALAEHVRVNGPARRDHLFAEAWIGAHRGSHTYQRDRDGKVSAPFPWLLQHARWGITENIRDTGAISRHYWDRLTPQQRLDPPAQLLPPANIDNAARNKPRTFIDPTDFTEAVATADAVHRLMRVLNRNQRHVIVALYWQDRTVADIASELGVVDSAVSRVKRRALNSMRRAHDAWQPHPIGVAA